MVCELIMRGPHDFSASVVMFEIKRNVFLSMVQSAVNENKIILIVIVDVNQIFFCAKIHRIRDLKY